MDVHMSVLEGSIGILPRRLMVVDRDLFLAKSILKENGIEAHGLRCLPRMRPDM